MRHLATKREVAAYEHSVKGGLAAHGGSGSGSGRSSGIGAEGAAASGVDQTHRRARDCAASGSAFGPDHIYTVCTRVSVTRGKLNDFDRRYSCSRFGSTSQDDFLSPLRQN